MLSEKIRKKFQASKYAAVKEWKDDTKCPLSLFTLTSVINQAKEPSVPSYIIMAYLLGTAPEEIAEDCKAAGDTVLWRLISPSGMTDEEKDILDRIKTLDAPKKKLVKDLLKGLGA